MKKTALTQTNFRDLLKLKSLEAKTNFQKNFPKAHQFLLEKGLEMNKLRAHSAKILASGALTGTLLIAPPTGVGELPSPSEIVKSIDDLNKDENRLPQKEFIDSLKQMLPNEVRPLSRDEEKRIEVVIKNITSIDARGSLEGEHLNTIYGYIGAEQHLKRYPGDVLENHGPYYKEGMAPGLGAWGYFAKSKADLTEDLIKKEKWYAVVQTLYLPDWGSRQPYLKNWYKHRKVLVVNTKNGNSVVAAVADSGPAAFTGKQFGGSPEVMEYLGGARYKKGSVLVFFVDDPENKVPLGPVDYNNLSVSKESLIEI
jgi:hypothetical protein